MPPGADSARYDLTFGFAYRSRTFLDLIEWNEIACNRY